MAFQFHFGTIERVVNPMLQLASSCFNSTLVRLRVAPTQPSIFIPIGFNSTLVRLRVARQTMYLLTGVFQFHFGTIERFMSSELDILSEVSIPLWYD